MHHHSLCCFLWWQMNEVWDCTSILQPHGTNIVMHHLSFVAFYDDKWMKSGIVPQYSNLMEQMYTNFYIIYLRTVGMVKWSFMILSPNLAGQEVPSYSAIAKEIDWLFVRMYVNQYSGEINECSCFERVRGRGSAYVLFKVMLFSWIRSSDCHCSSSSHVFSQMMASKKVQQATITLMHW